VAFIIFLKYKTLVAQAEPSIIDLIANVCYASEGKLVHISRDPVNNKMLRDKIILGIYLLKR